MEQKKSGRTPVPEADIHAAADQIAARGEEPTFKNVLAVLGTGSHPVITRGLNSWRVGREKSGAQGLPAEVVDFQLRMHKKAFAEGRSQSQGEIDALRAESESLSGELELAFETGETQKAACARLEAQFDSLTGELRAKDQEIDRLRNDAAQARMERDKAHRDSAVQAHQLNTALQDTTRLQTELDQTSRFLRQERDARAALALEHEKLKGAHEVTIERLDDSQRREKEYSDRLRETGSAPRPRAEASLGNVAVN